MIPIPAAAEPLVQAICGAFTEPTLQRFILLMSGLIVTMGRRTVSRALLLIAPHLQGHWCNYHRIYSQARYSMWKLGLALARETIKLLPRDKPIILLADDTVDQKDGEHVWGVGTHYDSKRSSRRFKHVNFGHQWLVMCVLVWLPGINRPWALPILCGLCRDKKLAKKSGKRPKPASHISKQMLIQLMRWFPDRKFILLGDSKAVSHAVACFANQHADRIAVISRLRSDGCLHAPPRRRNHCGIRGPKKGPKLPPPREQIKTLPRHRADVSWYGSIKRQVSYVSECALWYGKHDRERTIPIRWVGVLANKKQDLEEAYFYCSDPELDPRRIIELYALRWNIEVTFEETRALLGLETTRHWCQRSVLRVTPILFGLFTAVTLIWRQLPEKKRRCLSETPCYHKDHLTFADALYAVRRELWQTTLMGTHAQRRCLSHITRSLRQVILWHLSAAA